MVRTPSADPATPKATDEAGSPGLRSAAVALAVAFASLASPAAASPEASARLIRCGTESCLLITGHRDDPASAVSINGLPVPVKGRGSWRLTVPVETVRQWSAPYAREIEIALRDPATQRETTENVDLPIGLLGNVTTLALLEVRVD